MEQLFENIEHCISDLYRMAYFTVKDEALACSLVEWVCVRGADVLSTEYSPADVKIRLTGMLFRRCLLQRKLYMCGSGIFAGAARLCLALRFASGLSFEGARQAMGLSKRWFCGCLFWAARRTESQAEFAL